jgi:16S rRNA (guanine527-N7)-methyltransferase
VNVERDWSFKSTRDAHSAMSESSPGTAARLNELLAAAGIERLERDTADRFAAYCALLLRWNARMNLTAVRDEEGILSRHFVESIACARALPAGIATLLDFGSGAGFPGIPIALCRLEIAVTLAESQNKKAAFLREAVRSLGLTAAMYHGRAESIPIQFDCVALRAVDRMPEAIEMASRMIAPSGWLVVMTTDSAWKAMQSVSGAAILWTETLLLPGSKKRILTLGQRQGGLRAG